MALASQRGSSPGIPLLASQRGSSPGTALWWRISNHSDLLGTGDMLPSARWHTAGKPIVYLAETPSSALLEVLVHLELDEQHLPETYQLLKIEADVALTLDTVDPFSLTGGWEDDQTQTRATGDAWLKRGETTLLRVPSAPTPETWNWLLNPRGGRPARCGSCPRSDGRMTLVFFGFRGRSSGGVPCDLASLPRDTLRT